MSMLENENNSKSKRMLIIYAIHALLMQILVHGCIAVACCLPEKSPLRSRHMARCFDMT